MCALARGCTVAAMRTPRIPAADAWFALAAVLVAQVEIWVLGHGTAPRGLAAAASVLIGAGIAVRRRAPVTGLAAVVAGVGAIFAFSDSSSSDDAYFPGFALLLSGYSAGAHAQ